MSLMDKIKSLFGGGSSDAADAHAGHDHAGHDHAAHDQMPEPPTPAAPPVSQTGSAAMPTSEPQPNEEQDNRLE